MANKIVQPQEKNADGTYDNLIMQEAINAANATNVQNVDFSDDATALFVNKIVSKKVLLWDQLVTSSALNFPDTNPYTFSESISAGDVIEVWWYAGLTQPTSNSYWYITRFVVSSAITSNNQTPVLSAHSLSLTSGVRTIIYQDNAGLRLGNNSFAIKEAISVALNAPATEGGNVTTYFMRTIITGIRKIYKIIE